MDRKRHGAHKCPRTILKDDSRFAPSAGRHHHSLCRGYFLDYMEQKGVILAEKHERDLMRVLDVLAKEKLVLGAKMSKFCD